MDDKQLFSAVRQLWRFTEENYRGFGSLSETGQLVFALNHVLKHQAKGSARWIAWLQGKKMFDVWEPMEQVRTFVFNSIRFAILAGLTHEDVQAGFAMWKRKRSTGDARAELSESPVFIPLALMQVTGETFGLLEPADHRHDRFTRECEDGLRRSARELLTLSITLAKRHGYTRTEFEKWIARRCTMNFLVP